MPADVDLRGYEFIPLFGDRLFGSETWIGIGPEAKLAAIQLWWRAYAKEVPASSLPDNDALLANYAGYGTQVKAWRRVKAEAMRGFTLCTDGRWYHAFVAELALTAWKGRQQHQMRTLKARIAALEKRMVKAETDEDKAHLTSLLQPLRQALCDALQPSVTDPCYTPCDTVSEGEERERTERGEGKEKPKPRFAPPDWVPPDAWAAYVAMRKAIRKAMTPEAMELAIVRLDKLRGEGHDPRAVLEQSIFHSWQGLFEIKPNGAGKAPTGNRQESLEERNRKATEGWRPPEIRDAG